MRFWIESRTCLLVTALVLAGTGTAPAADTGAPRGNAKGTSAKLAADTMQLLQANCLSCHNAEKQKGGLRLTSRSTLLKGGENGAVVVSGKPDKSRLLHALAADADPHMPPKKQLTAAQIELVRNWIGAGAPYDPAALLKPRGVPAARLEGLPANYRPVLALALAPQGDRLAVARENHLIIFDVQSTNFAVIHDVPAHVDAVRSLAWSSDGRFVASGAYRELKVWRANDLAPVWSQGTNQLEGHVTALRFTPFSGALAAAEGRPAGTNWVRLFGAESGKPIAAWEAHADTVFDLSISADAGLLATASNDRMVKLWELVSQKEVARLEAHAGAIFGVSFNTNANEVVTVGADKQLKVWDVATRQSVVAVANRKHSFNTVVWSADGTTVVAGDDAGALVAFTDFKRHSGAQSSDTAREHSLGKWGEPIHAIAVASDAKRIFAGTHTGTVYVVDGAGALLAKLDPPALTPSAPTLPPLAIARAEPGPRAAKRVRNREPLPVNDAGPAGESAPSFTRDVLPLLAKAGCSAGACHAKPEGQNGFKLSVFSYDPKADYAELVKEARGRRVFPAAPAASLLLLKPTAAIEHGGGQRFAPGSATYQTLVRWIRGGLVYQHTNEPALTGISVVPRDSTFRPGTKIQLKVTAQWTDGSTRDVTALAEYVSQEKEIARVDEHGAVQVGSLQGAGAVIARYMGFVDAAHVTVPPARTLPGARYAALPVGNFIDELGYAHFQKLGLFPAGRSTDAEFLRRSALDIAGALPAPEAARAFLLATNAAKRADWIEEQLAHAGYADYWANKWADLLRPNPDRVGVKSVLTLDQWLREAFRANMPYDQFVRAIVEAEGTNHRDGPAVVYRDRREPPELTATFSQLFLGVRMECARCHHHPNEKWSQDDFYQFAAFFGPLKHKGAGLSPPISAGTETFYFAPGGSVKHPVTEEVMLPRPLDGKPVELKENVDPRQVLADWMTNPDNPFFAKAAVNRVWAAMFGRGLVEPVDDFRASNPAVNEPLLEQLARDFARHGYDLKHLIRTIAQSELYQLSSEANEFNRADTRNFSRSYRRRLPAEVMLDAVNDVTGVPDEFNGCAPGTRAVQTWSYKIPSHFMDAFGRPNPSSDCPCERDLRTSIVQSLHLMNSKNLQAKLAHAKGRARLLADGKQTPMEIVTELYLAAYSRFPAPDEAETAVRAFSIAEANRRAATEDVLWALLNSAEFVFNH